MHLITTSNPALEELRRQLREGEITLYAYKQGERAALVAEPAPTQCSAPGCTRDAHRIERGKPLCAVCSLKARTRQRGRI